MSVLNYGVNRSAFRPQDGTTRYLEPAVGTQPVQRKIHPVWRRCSASASVAVGYVPRLMIHTEAATIIPPTTLAPVMCSPSKSAPSTSATGGSR